MSGHRWRTGSRRPARPRSAALVAAVVSAVLAGATVVGVGVAATPAPGPAAPASGAASPGPDRLRADLPLLGHDTAAPARSAAPSAQVPAAAPTSGARANAPAATPASTTAAPAAEGLAAGTPCAATAKACVELSTRRAWLLDGGKIVRGPVGSRHGDRDGPTPAGTFSVQWKAENYTSHEFGTAMPYSVFFAPGGIAFHEGRQDTPSAGCVKLAHEDAVAWFAYLQIGDEVEVR